MNVFTRRCPHNRILGAKDRCELCDAKSERELSARRERAIKQAGPPQLGGGSPLINGVVGHDEAQVVERLGCMRTRDGKIEPLLDALGLPKTKAELVARPWLHERLVFVDGLFRVRGSRVFLLMHRLMGKLVGYVMRCEEDDLSGRVTFERDDTLSEELMRPWGGDLGGVYVDNVLQKTGAWLVKVAPAIAVESRQIVNDGRRIKELVDEIQDDVSIRHRFDGYTNIEAGPAVAARRSTAAETAALRAPDTRPIEPGDINGGCIRILDAAHRVLVDYQVPDDLFRGVSGRDELVALRGFEMDIVATGTAEVVIYLRRDGTHLSFAPYASFGITSRSLCVPHTIKMFGMTLNGETALPRLPDEPAKGTEWTVRSSQAVGFTTKPDAVKLDAVGTQPPFLDDVVLGSPMLGMWQARGSRARFEVVLEGGGAYDGTKPRVWTRDILSDRWEIDADLTECFKRRYPYRQLLPKAVAAWLVEVAPEKSGTRWNVADAKIAAAELKLSPQAFLEAPPPPPAHTNLSAPEQKYLLDHIVVAMQLEAAERRRLEVDGKKVVNFYWSYGKGGAHLVFHVDKPGPYQALSIEHGATLSDLECLVRFKARHPSARLTTVGCPMGGVLMRMTYEDDSAARY